MLITQKITMQNAATAAGNGTAVEVSDKAQLAMQITGTFVATVTFEGTVDGTNWVAIPALDVNTGQAVQETDSTGIFVCTAAGLESIRARVSAYTSGSVTVVGIATTTPALRDWPQNAELTLLASAARTVTTNSPDQINQHARGVLVTLDVTAGTTLDLTLSVEAKMGGKYEALLTASASLSGVDIASYLVYPGAGSAGGDVTQVAGFPLPRNWRVTVTHGNANSATYSVVASYIQ